MVVEAIVRMFSWPSLGFCGLLWAGLMLTGVVVCVFAGWWGSVVAAGCGGL